MKKLFNSLAFLTLLLLPALLPAVTVTGYTPTGTYIFPTNRTYSFGLKPTVGAGDAQTMQTKYEGWKAAHIVSTGAGGYLRVQRTEYVGTGSMYDTVSEGIAYGMLLAVYFCDQNTFDKLFQYKTLHNDSNGLMNWRIDQGGGTTGFNGATDSDTDITYALYLASYQWGTSATLGSTYLALATNEYLKIKQYEFTGNHVHPGDAFDSCRYPSYFFPNQYSVFGKRNTGDASFWSSISSQCYTTIGAVRNNTTGLVPETCLDNGSGGSCVDSTTQYLYNSCRVPWRVAMDYCYYGTGNAKTELQKVESWLASTAPNTTGDGYDLNGNKVSNSNNAAFTGPFACAFMEGNQSQLNTYYASVLNMGFNGEYYNGALQLLTLLFMSGNMPNIADPAAIYTLTVTPTTVPGSPTYTSTATPVPSALVFEDFEPGIANSAFSYGGPSAATSYVTYSTPFGGAYNGNFAEKNVVNVATGGWAGFGCQSNYANAQGVVDATGAQSITFWMKSDKPVNFQFSVHEGTVAGGDGENYISKSQSCAGDNTWHFFELPLTFVGTTTPGVTQMFYLDANSGSQTGGKVLNLASMKEIQIGYAAPLTSATVQIDDIGFKLSVAYTPTATSTPFDNPYNQIFDDYESPLSLRRVPAPAMCDGTSDTFSGASFGWSVVSNSSFGTQCGSITYTSGTGTSWGISAYEFSPYQTPAKFVDASGAVYLGMWLYQTVAGLRYQLEFQEANNTVVGADGEAWLSQISTLNTTGWQWVQFQVQTFKKDKYTGNQAGNNLKDMMAISTVAIKILGGQGSGQLLVDNITFITTWKTATPTISPSPTVSPTLTPFVSSTSTVSPSPSASVTGTTTRTTTPSPSPSATASVTPSSTLTRTPLPSNTSTQTPGPSNTSTGTVTPSSTATTSGTPLPSGTQTVTMSVTPSRTGTATPSSSPTPSGTSTSTSTSTITPTGTESLTFTVSPTQTDYAGTPTNTETSTATASVTPTHTRTSSPTVTATATPSDTPLPSATGTASPSRTETPLPTGTSTGTVSPSSTLSLTPGNTATQTQTPLGSSTSTQTPANTATGTSTAVVSGTRTITPGSSPTYTATAVSTATRTNTVVVSSTSTNTPGSSPTYTNTPANTATRSSTQTLGASATLTVTPTATPSRTAQSTGTSTVTPANTATRTVTPMNTVTRTATQTVALPATATSTPGDSPNMGDVEKVVLVPNPVFSRLVDNRVYFKTTGYVEDVVIKAYTRNMVCVGTWSTGPCRRAGWQSASINRDEIFAQPSGTLFLVVKAKGQSKAFKLAMVLVK